MQKKTATLLVPVHTRLPPASCLQLQVCVATVALKLHAWHFMKKLAAESRSCNPIQREFVLPMSADDVMRSSAQSL